MKVFELNLATSVMHFIRILLLILLLSPCLTQEQPHPQLRFLHQLLRVIKKSQALSTIYMLRHHGADNCLIEDWKPRDMAFVRSTEMATFEVRTSSNIDQTMALVCISQDSDVRLLNNLARSFNYMRHERIILWMQVKATEKLLHKICGMAERYLFGQMLVLEMINSGNGTLKVFRLQPFPSPHFDLVDNVFTIDGIFHDSLINFHGKEVIVLPRKDNLLEYNVSYGPKKTILINTHEDRHIIEFSLKKNLSLKVVSKNHENIHRYSRRHFDLQLTPHLVSTKDIQECANPFTVVSLIVVVPCGQERSIQDVFKHLNFEGCLLYILPVYATFVVVEWLMHVFIYRMTGRAHRLGFLNPLVNLRAFAAILGLSFPVSRRWSFSLRQLFLALSVFGFVFSNFFACKLSALLTKHSRYAQVQNLEELRDSGLQVAIDKADRDYLERDMDPFFLPTLVPNIVIFDVRERHRMILSLNDSFAYVIFKEFFLLVDEYQKALGRKVLCDATNLTINSNLPIMFHLPENSLLKWPLRTFIHKIYESGIHEHWKINSIYMQRMVLNLTIPSVVKQEAIPLSFEHFNWLWSLLLLGHGIATLVFLVELLTGGVKNWMRKQQVRVSLPEA